MGIEEQRWGPLALVSFHLGDTLLGDALLGDALPWRRFLLATLPLGDACTWRHPHLGDALR